MQNDSEVLIRSFDARYTTNDIKVMKILHSGLPPERQAEVACLIRLLELQSLQSSSPEVQACDTPAPSSTDPVSLLQFCLPYLKEDMRKLLEQALELLSTFRMVQQTLETAEMMKDLFPSEDSSDALSPDILSALFQASGMDIDSILKSAEGGTENGPDNTGMDEG